MAEFNSVSVDLDLTVPSAQELQDSPGVGAHYVTGTVGGARARHRGVKLVGERGRRGLGVAAVTESERGTGHIQLARRVALPEVPAIGTDEQPCRAQSGADGYGPSIADIFEV